MSDIYETGLNTGGVPILETDGSNFLEWLDLVKKVLLSKGLWDYATGDISKPSIRDAAREFEKVDARATVFLKIAAGQNQGIHLIGLKSSKDVLDKLTVMHQGVQEDRLLRLLTQFHVFKAQGDIELRAKKLTLLQQAIAGIDQDEKPSDTMKKLVLLDSLPQEYQSTVFALKAAGLWKITFEDMVQRLKATETSRMGHGMPESEIKLARTIGKRYNGVKAESNRPQRNRTGQKHAEDRRCHYCGLTGHFVRNCWRRMADEEKDAKGEN